MRGLPAGCSRRLPAGTSPPSRSTPARGFDAFVIVTEGAVTLTIGGTPVHATPGTIVRMPANVPHAVEAIERTRFLLVMLREQATGPQSM